MLGTQGTMVRETAIVVHRAAIPLPNLPKRLCTEIQLEASAEEAIALFP